MLRNKTRRIDTKFLVIKGHTDSPPLLSKASLEDLGMLKIEPRGTLREQNSLRIKAVQSNRKAENKEMEEILRKYLKALELSKSQAQEKILKSTLKWKKMKSQ